MRTYSVSLSIVLLCTFCIAATTAASSQDRKSGTSAGTMREPNLSAPDLFAERLSFKAALVDLPGYSDPKSSWELNYEVYFIPESEYYSVIDRLPPGQHNLEAGTFNRKFLLGENRIKKVLLTTPQERSDIKEIYFKSKVPEKDKTKFARLLTAYSVKIYDAHLKLPIYHSGVFVTNIFEKNPDNTQVGPKKTLYLNFSVSPDGTLSYSQRAKQ
jgi:hypothetical protein